MTKLNVSLERPAKYAIFASTLFISVAQHASSMLIPLHILGMGGGESMAAAMSGFQRLGSFLINIPAGAAMARYGGRAIMIGSSGLFAVGIAVTMFIGSPSVLALGVALMGAGFGGWFLSRTSYVGALTPADERGQRMASLSGTGRFGRLVGPLLGGVFVGAVGYVASFAAMLALSVITVVLLSVLCPGRREQIDSDRPGMQMSFWSVIRRDGQTLFVGASAISAVKLLKVTHGVLTPILGVSIGLTEATLGALIGISSVVDLSMARPAGALFDRFGRNWTIGISAACSIAGLSCYSFANSILVFVSGVILMGCGSGLSGGLSMTLAVDFAPGDGRDKFLALWKQITDIGSVSAPFIVAAVASVSVIWVPPVVSAVVIIILVGATIFAPKEFVS